MTVRLSLATQPNGLPNRYFVLMKLCSGTATLSWTNSIMLIHRIGPYLVFAATALGATSAPPAAAHRHVQGTNATGTPLSMPGVVANDNRRPAGTLADGVLTLELRAASGLWQPQGASGPALRVQAFGEEGQSLSTPAPLIRVPEGTEIAVSIRNELPDGLRVHGLCERGVAACAPIPVAPGETRRTQFVTGPAGTYQYWATSTGMPFTFRAAEDSQLSGAFVVDAPGTPSGGDRLFVITEWTSVTRQQLQELAAQDDPGAYFLKMKPTVLFAMNGLAWPHTERLTYHLGEAVRWRVVNLSTQVHPMHLHGFYFEVDSLGDGTRDVTFASGARQRVVTQLMQPGSTMSMTWTPERIGNWLFHCHVMTHVSPVLHVDGSPKPHAQHGGHAGHDAGAGMTGMVLGVTVVGPDDAQPSTVEHGAETRALTLDMRAEPARFGTEPAYGFALADDPATPPTASVPVPGPTLVLTRGQPVAITLRNRLPEGTAIHWHGMELDSYYDGVHGWSGSGLRITPMIQPGESFVVRFTPPRTGTFMYHTHLHDHRQLTSGLYGGLVVVEPGEDFDDRLDHVILLGRNGPQVGAPTVINGQRSPQMVWKAGARHRVRLANITPDDTLSVTLQSRTGPVVWQPLTKDGAPLPPGRGQARTAQQLIGVGEIYDFEFEAPSGRQTLWLEIRSPGGKWHAQGQVIVK